MTVADDGIGITEEAKDKLFKQFHSTKGSHGTGLGPVITRKVVQEHGGTIRVESEPGKETSFTIRIPFGLSSCGDTAKTAGCVS
jgi:signal transduction histidine kinase